MQNFEVHVISLKDSTERRKSISDQLNRLNLTYNFWDAVIGAEPCLSKEYLDFGLFVKFHKREMHPGEAGCALSHITLWDKISISDKKWHVILEDDACLSRNFKTNINKLSEKLTTNSVLMLYWSGVGFSFFKCAISHNCLAFRANAPFCGTVGYLISKDTAKDFHEHLKKQKLSSPIDNFYGTNSIGFDSYADFYLSIPRLVTTGLFESEIDKIQKRTEIELSAINKFMNKLKYCIKFMLNGLNIKF